VRLRDDGRNMRDKKPPEAGVIKIRSCRTADVCVSGWPGGVVSGWSYVGTRGRKTGTRSANWGEDPPVT
jgi:hypothetical protein